MLAACMYVRPQEHAEQRGCMRKPHHLKLILMLNEKVLNVVKAGYGAFLSFFKEKSYSFFLLVDKDDHLSS